MLMACFSDIHGNKPALEAALADAKARGAEALVCAGDITGYGPFPDDVCRFLKREEIAAITGNYDQKVIEAAREGNAVTVAMAPKKRRILRWTVEHLSRQSLRYLAGLPDRLDRRLASGHSVLVVHGSPLSPEDTVYPSITGTGLETKLGDLRPDVLVCGHTHIPFVKRLRGILIVNCGSAGHPVDGDPRPAYALVRAEQDTLPHGQIIRFDYDREKTLSALKKTSLPKGLRRDFSEGNKRRFLP